MTKEAPLEDPTGRAVAVFSQLERAQAARQALIEAGFADDEVRLIHGQQEADEIDASAKWFADTDDELAKLKLAVDKGKALLSVAVPDKDRLPEIERICAANDGEQLAHFGDWVLERKAL